MISFSSANLGRCMNRNRLVTAGVLLMAMMAVTSAALVARTALEPLAFESAWQASDAASARPAAKLRIGTYDSRAVAVAHGRSDLFMNKFKDLQRQHAEAEKAGDTKRIEQLKAQAESMQMRMHLQVFSDGPVDDVIEAVRDKLPSVAKQMNVSAIARAVDYHESATVEVVDVTDELVALFNPDKQTLKVVEDLRPSKPAPIEDVARMPVVK